MGRRTETEAVHKKISYVFAKHIEFFLADLCVGKSFATPQSVPLAQGSLEKRLFIVSFGNKFLLPSCRLDAASLQGWHLRCPFGYAVIWSEDQAGKCGADYTNGSTEDDVAGVMLAEVNARDTDAGADHHNPR